MNIRNGFSIVQCPLLNLWTLRLYLDNILNHKAADGIMGSIILDYKATRHKWLLSMGEHSSFRLSCHVNSYKLDLNICTRGWSDAQLVKSHCCSLRLPKFDSQHSKGDSRIFFWLPRAPGTPCCTDIHIIRTPIHIMWNNNKFKNCKEFL